MKKPHEEIDAKLPDLDEVVDLSVAVQHWDSVNEYMGLLAFDDHRRKLIQRYKKSVKANLDAEVLIDDIPKTITPWGAWFEHEGKDGVYSLTSTLNNRVLDGLLGYPQTPDDEEIRTRVNGGSGPHLSWSLELRRLARKNSWDRLSEAIFDNQNGRLDVEVWPCYPSPTEMAIRKTKGGVNHNISFALNDRLDERPIWQKKNKMLFHSVGDKLMPPLGGEKEFRKERVSFGVEKKHLDTLSLGRYGFLRHHDPDYYADEVFDYEENPLQQKLFIDLQTLAFLSLDTPPRFPIQEPYQDQNTITFVNHRLEYEGHWQVFLISLALSGLPSSLTEFDQIVEPKRTLGPSGCKCDPIATIVHAMWAAGAADDFQIILSLNHPDPKKRGAYFTFTLDGRGHRKLIAAEQSLKPNAGRTFPEICSEMLNEPLHKEEPKAVETSFVSAFDKAFQST